MKILGSVVSYSFIFPHPPDEKKKKNLVSSDPGSNVVSSDSGLHSGALLPFPPHYNTRNVPSFFFIARRVQHFDDSLRFVHYITAQRQKNNNSNDDDGGDVQIQAPTRTSTMPRIA